MFVIKKIVGILTQPGVLVLLLLIAGLLRLLFSRGPKKRGWVWISLGTGCLYLFTTAPLPNYLLGRLERELRGRRRPQNKGRGRLLRHRIYPSVEHVVTYRR